MWSISPSGTSAFSVKLNEIPLCVCWRPPIEDRASTFYSLYVNSSWDPSRTPCAKLINCLREMCSFNSSRGLLGTMASSSLWVPSHQVLAMCLFIGTRFGAANFQLFLFPYISKHVVGSLSFSIFGVWCCALLLPLATTASYSVSSCEINKSGNFVVN